MKWTRAYVEEYAKGRGLEPVQIDGIPEGFSFIGPDIQIGDVWHGGYFYAFIPNGDTENKETLIQEKSPFELLEKFNKPIRR